MMEFKKFFSGPAQIISRLFGAWCMASAFTLILTDDDYIWFVVSPALRLVLFVGLVAGGFVLATALETLRKEFLPGFLLGSVLFYGVVVLSRQYGAENNFYLLLGILLVLLAVIWYIMHDNKLSLGGWDISSRTVKVLLIIGVVLFVLYVGGLTVYRLLCYGSPCFDFGIFSQMFHYMRETFQPYTTCERDGLLSHFAVHVSPIYYIALPFYAIFPYPATLLIFQAMMLASGVIPLYLLARSFRLSGKVTLSFCAIYLLYPAFIGGSFFDIHENQFLLPLLLWLFWAMETRRIPLVYVFSVLTLLVKEDAPVYVAFAALYYFFCKKERTHGAMMLAGSILYFTGAVTLLNTYGLGVMTGRFSNVLGEDGSLTGMVINLLTAPVKVLAESMKPEKLIFAGYMLLPLGMLPLANKKPSRLILLGPMILMNMIPDYIYQHSIDFQYTYGSGAFLFYLAMINLSELSAAAKRTLLSLALSATMMIAVLRMPGHTGYFARYYDNKEKLDTITEVLETIPEEASVAASTMFTPKLANRDILYRIGMTDKEAEYIALDLRYQEGNTFYAQYVAQGYTVVTYRPGAVALLINPNYAPQP